MRRILLILTLVAICFVNACSRDTKQSSAKNSEGSSSDVTDSSIDIASSVGPEEPTDTPEEIEVITPAPAGDNTLISFAVCGSVDKLNRNQKMINDRIHEDGLDVNVFFYQVDAIKPDGLANEYKAFEEQNGKPYDIASTGIWPDNIADAEFVSSGYFYNINEYLNSEEGKKLKEIFSENEWNSVEINGKIFDFPAYTCVDPYCPNVYLCEEKDVNADIDSLLKLCDESDVTGKNKLFIAREDYGILSLAGISRTSCAPFKYAEEKFVNPFTDPDLIKIINTIVEENEKRIIYDSSDKFFEYTDIYAAVMPEAYVPDEMKSNKTSLLPYCLSHSNGASFGVVNGSENKEKALELMYLIYTDKKLADMLVYECVAEYENGKVSNFEWDMRGDLWGIGAFASPVKSQNTDDRRVTIKEWEKDACWDYCTFIPELDDEERKILNKAGNKLAMINVNANSNYLSSCLTEEENRQFDLVIEKLNKQFEEWKKTR